MSRKDIELIKAETRRLEALGVVLRNIGQVANLYRSPKKLGRKRVYADNAAKIRAYRERQFGKPLAEIVESKKVTDIQKVAKKRSVSV